MSFILGGEQIDQIDFSGASIYLDACFIISYIDLPDSRRPEVARVLDVWSEYPGVVLGMSNHTVAEVINRLFKIKVLGALEVYQTNNSRINQIKNGYDLLSEEDKIKLVDLKGAQFLSGLAKREKISFNRNDANAKVMKLIKLAKEDENKRQLLDVFYEAAVTTFEEFIYQMTEDVGFDKIEILNSTAKISYPTAKVNMKMLQLDITDSFHLAIAHENRYHYLATLDGDFVNNFYSRSSVTTKIIKVA